MPHFEREFWQATVQFGAESNVAPAAAAAFLNEISQLELGAVHWQLPAMAPGGGGVQFEVGPAGLTPVQPDFIIGTSTSGWIVRFSARQLVVRHQELVDGGVRQLQRDQFPDQRTFAEVVGRAVRALPAGLTARRTSLAVNYAMFTGEVYAASVLSELLGRGKRCAAPPPDGSQFTTTLNQLEFETVAGRRYAWNDLTGVGSWFGPHGQLLLNSAVIRSVDVKTASVEPPFPVALAPMLDALPPLSRDEVLSFFSVDGPFGLRRVLARIRRSLPEGVEVHD